MIYFQYKNRCQIVIYDVGGIDQFNDILSNVKLPDIQLVMIIRFDFGFFRLNSVVE